MRSSRTLYLETLEDRTALSADLHAVLGADFGPQRDHNEPQIRASRTTTSEIGIVADVSVLNALIEKSTPTETTASRPASPVAEPARSAPLATASEIGPERNSRTERSKAMELEQRPESERSEDDFSELRHSAIEAAAIVPDRDEANSSLFESARVAILGSMQIFGTIRPGTGDGFRLSAATLPVGYLPAKELPQEPTEVSEEFFSQSGSRSTLAEMLLKLQIRDAPFGDLSAAPALTPLTRQLFDQLRQDMLVAARKILSESQYREFSRALQARPAEQGNESDSESIPSGAGATPEN